MKTFERSVKAFGGLTNPKVLRFCKPQDFLDPDVQCGSVLGDLARKRPVDQAACRETLDLQDFGAADSALDGLLDGTDQFFEIEGLLQKAEDLLGRISAAERVGFVITAG